MLIRTLITAILAAGAFWLTMRYNMHMFQLNVYMNGEQRAWIRKNFRLQWILVFAMGLGIVRMLLTLTAVGSDGWLAWAADILVWLTLAVIILVYRVMKDMNQKKKLVFTARVKRMVACIIILCLIFLAAVFLIGGLAPVSGALLLLTGSPSGSAHLQSRSIWTEMIGVRFVHMNNRLLK